MFSKILKLQAFLFVYFLFQVFANASPPSKTCSSLWNRVHSIGKKVSFISPLQSKIRSFNKIHSNSFTKSFFNRLVSLINPLDYSETLLHRKAKKLISLVQSDSNLQKSMHELLVSKLSSSLVPIDGKKGKLHLLSIYNHIFPEGSIFFHLSRKLLKEARVKLYHIETDKENNTLFSQLYYNKFFTHPNSSLSSRDKLFFLNPLFTQNIANEELLLRVFSILPELTLSENLEMIKAFFLPSNPSSKFLITLQRNALILLQMSLFIESPLRTKTIDFNAVSFVNNIAKFFHHEEQMAILFADLLDKPNILIDLNLDTTQGILNYRPNKIKSLSQTNYLNLIIILQRALLHSDTSINHFSLSVLESLIKLGIITSIEDVISPYLESRLENKGFVHSSIYETPGDQSKELSPP